MRARAPTRVLTAMLRFVPALLWATLIFFLSSQPRLPRGLSLFDGFDKVAHAGVFGVLTLLLLFGAGFPRGWRAWGWVALAILYGVSDEIHQSFVPGRSVELYDGLADVLGAVGAYGLTRIAGSQSSDPTEPIAR